MTFAPYSKICVDQLMATSYNNPNRKDPVINLCNERWSTICSSPDYFDKSRYNMFTLWKCQGDNWQNTKLGNEQIQKICSGDYLNNPDCMYYCNNKTGERSCDANIYEYCKNPENFDKPVCACYMPDSFYQNIVSGLNKAFKTNLKYSGNPSCVYPKCALSTLKPEAIRGKSCQMSITSCIDDIKVDKDGNIIQTPVLKSKNCLDNFSLKSNINLVNFKENPNSWKGFGIFLIIILIAILYKFLNK